MSFLDLLQVRDDVGSERRVLREICEPGHSARVARLDVPGMVLYGGSIMAGTLPSRN